MDRCLLPVELTSGVDHFATEQVVVLLQCCPFFCQERKAGELPIQRPASNIQRACRLLLVPAGQQQQLERVARLQDLRTGVRVRDGKQQTVNAGRVAFSTKATAASCRMFCRYKAALHLGRP